MDSQANPSPSFVGKRFVVVCRIESLDQRTRVAKVTKVLKSLGAEVVLWKLRSGRSSPQQLPEIAIAGPRHGTVGKLIELLLWIVNLFIQARKAPSTNYYWCVGLDSAGPVCAAGRRDRMVFDHADNLSKSYRLPLLVKRAIGAIEHLVARSARLHLVPSESRWPAADANRRIVANLPSRLIFTEAHAIAKARHYQRPDVLTLYVNGWLTPTRGIRTLCRAIAILERRKVAIRILVAGAAGGNDSNQLIADARTEYKGLVSNAEALALYLRSSLVFTYYDPSLEINRIAEPNKWGDCVATRTPFICNREIVTAKQYVDLGCCISLPYSDEAGLADALENLSRSPSRLKRLELAFDGLPIQFWDDHVAAIAYECVGETA